MTAVKTISVAGGSRVIQKGDGRLEVEATLRRFSDGYVRVGIIDGEEPDADGRLTMGELAAIHEFGAPAAGIPPRSFVWLGTQLVKDEMKRLMARLIRDVSRGHTTERAALRKMAELLQTGMRRTFAEWQAHWDPLSPKTIARKGHDQPLIDTRALYEAINYEIVMKSGGRGK